MSDSEENARLVEPEVYDPTQTDPGYEAHWQSLLQAHYHGTIPEEDCPVCQGEEPDTSELSSPAGLASHAPSPPTVAPHSFLADHPPSRPSNLRWRVIIVRRDKLDDWLMVTEANDREVAVYSAVESLLSKAGRTVGLNFKTEIVHTQELLEQGHHDFWFMVVLDRVLEDNPDFVEGFRPPENTAQEALEEYMGSAHGLAFSAHSDAATKHEACVGDLPSLDMLKGALAATEAAHLATLLIDPNDYGVIMARSVNPFTWSTMAKREAQRGSHGAAARAHRLAAQSHEEAGQIPVDTLDRLPQGRILADVFVEAVVDSETNAREAIRAANQGNLALAQNRLGAATKANRQAHRLSAALLDSVENAAEEAELLVGSLPSVVVVSSHEDEPFPPELKQTMLDWVAARRMDWDDEEWATFLYDQLGAGTINTILIEWDQEIHELEAERADEAEDERAVRERSKGDISDE